MAFEARVSRESGLAERRLRAEHVIARALVEASTFADAIPNTQPATTAAIPAHTCFAIIASILP